MRKDLAMSDHAKELAENAASRYERAVALGHEDLQLRAVKYLLLRLTGAGLQMSEVEPLRALAGSAFQESNVTNEVEDVRKQSNSSPLALALAGIVGQARGSKRMAMLGAVLGAHAARGARGADGSRDGLAEIQGAIVGASVFETNRMLEEMIASPSWSSFATKE
jgi:hypothetical protein